MTDETQSAPSKDKLAGDDRQAKDKQVRNNAPAENGNKVKRQHRTAAQKLAALDDAKANLKEQMRKSRHRGIILFGTGVLKRAEKSPPLWDLLMAIKAAAAEERDREAFDLAWQSFGLTDQRPKPPEKDSKTSSTPTRQEQKKEEV